MHVGAGPEIQLQAWIEMEMNARSTEQVTTAQAQALLPSASFDLIKEQINQYKRVASRPSPCIHAMPFLTDGSLTTLSFHMSYFCSECR